MDYMEFNECNIFWYEEYVLYLRFEFDIGDLWFLFN